LDDIKLKDTLTKVFKSFHKYKKVYPSDKSPKIFYWLLVSAFLFSLNVDVFSRNIFVVFVVLYFIPSAQRTKQVLK